MPPDDSIRERFTVFPDFFCFCVPEISYICADFNPSEKKNSYFILTRFNLNLYPRDKRQMPTRTRQWLEHRFEVFERYCLPSVVAQTDKNFTWLCLFDSQTPDEFRSRIEGYSRVCPQFRAVWYDAAQAASLTESLRATLLDCKSSESGPGNSPPLGPSC